MSDDPGKPDSESSRDPPSKTPAKRSKPKPKQKRVRKSPFTKTRTPRTLQGKNKSGKPRSKPGRTTGPKTKLNFTKYAEIQRLWLRGVSVTELSTKFGVTHGRISQIITEYQSLLISENTRGRDAILAELAMVRAVAWEKLDQSAEPITEHRVEELFALIDKRKEREAITRKVVQLVRHRTGESQWLDVIRWAVDFECRITGIFNSQPLNPESGLRYAGSDPEAIDDAMVRRMAEAIVKRREMIAKIGLRPPPIVVTGTVVENKTEQTKGNGNGKPEGEQPPRTSPNGKH